MSGGASGYPGGSRISISAADTWNFLLRQLEVDQYDTLVSTVRGFTVRQGRGHPNIDGRRKGGGSRITFRRLIGSGKETLQPFSFEGHELVVFDRVVRLPTHFQPHSVRLRNAGQAL